MSQPRLNHESSSNDDNHNAIRNSEVLLRDTGGPSSSADARVVDLDIEGGSGERDNRTGGGKYEISMGRLAASRPEAYERLAKEVEEMGRGFLEYFRGPFVKGSWRYVTDVVCYDSDDALERLLGCLRAYGRRRLNGMFSFSVEPGHVHVIHDCNYSAGCCRCVWRREASVFGNIKPASRRAKYIYAFTRNDWYDVFLYFFVKKRGTREIWCRGESREVPDYTQLVRWQEICEPWGEVVRCEDSWNPMQRERQGDDRNGGATSPPSYTEVYGKKTASCRKYESIKIQTKTLLLKYYCSPVSSIRDVDEFRKNSLLSDPKNKEYILAAMEDFGKDINEMSLRDIYNVLKDEKPIFMKSMYYGGNEQSVEIIDSLLKFQFDDNDEEISSFLTTLVDILDKRITKLNTIVVIGPPSSGKNFFFDMVLAICLNYGQLGQANRHNNFAFQEAPNKRVLLWNEPNYESSLTDTIKMMLGGDPYTVRVKHNMDTHVQRTPVIVLTNNVVNFMVENAFQDRIVKYKWKRAPFLKEIDYKPYPMSLFTIFNKYNVAFYDAASNIESAIGYKPLKVAQSSPASL